MKTMNTTISSIKKYICMALLIGASVNAWGTTITLKVWDSTNEVFVTWGTFEKGDKPGYGPTDGGWYYNVAWAPGDQNQSHGNYSKNYPTNGGSDNGSTWFNQYAFPTSDYNGEATILYAVYDDGYNYTTRPYMTFADLAGCTTGPTVTAGGNSSVASTSATVTCSSGISDLGDCAITSYGFVYGTSSNPTTSNTAIQVGTTYTSTGTSFSKNLTDLNASTTYYVRPYATNGYGTSYGTQTSFTTLAQYTISYNNNGGSGSIGSQTKDHGVTATLNGGASFSKTGYELSKWHTAADGTSGTDYALGGSYTANANVTMHAVWEPNTYTITLNNQSATSAGTESIEVTYNDDDNLDGTPAITVPTKTGYEFGGYYTSAGGSGVQIIAANGNVNSEVTDAVEIYTSEDKEWLYAGDLTLYAKWTANTINLTLDKNNSDVSGSNNGSAIVRYDSIAVRPSSITHATRGDDYNLVGYYAEVGTTTKVLESNGAFAADDVTGYITDGKWSCTTSPTTLYAKWSKTTYTVTFNMHGHGSIDNQVVESGETAAKPSPDPYVEDYHFLGWFTDDGEGGPTNTEFSFSTTITGNTTIHAKWEEVTYNTTTYKAWCDPDIEITGDIHLTSTNGIAVYSTSTTSNLLGINSHDLAGVTKLDIKYLDADNGDAEVANASSRFRVCSSSDYSVADGSQIDVSAANTCDLSYSIRYTPNDYDVVNHYKLQITMKRGTRAVKTVTKDLYGRSLPEEFVVASKFDGEWYALPNTLESLEANAKAVAGIKITVDNTTSPEAATYAPDIAVYQAEGRNAANTNRYAIRLTDGTNHLQVSTTSSKNVMWLSSTGSASCQDWWLSSSDFGAYSVTIPSNTGNASKKIGMVGGNIGYYASPTSPSGQIYFLPITHKLVDNDAIVTEWGQTSVILDVDAQSASGAQARLGAGDPETAASFGQTRTSVEGAASKYNYTLRFGTLDFSEHKGELLYIDWLDEGDNVLSTSAITIPWIIARGDKSMYTIDGIKSHWSSEEVHVLSGVNWEVDAGEFESKNVTIKTLEVYPGATVNVTKGTKADGTLNVTNLVMRNGWTRAGSKEYDVARVFINSDNASLVASNAYADWYIDFDQYYPVAVPWSVTTSGMTYKNSNSAARAGVKMRYYDGASRATNGQTGVGDGANWKEFSRTEEAITYKYPATLTPGIGYAMTARRPSGKAFSIIRMPLTIPSAAWTASGEQGEVSSVHKDQVSVTAHGVSDDSKPRYTVGWNFIANPYMALYQGEITHSEGDAYDIAYVNIPDINFKEYGQYPVGEGLTKLAPASGFFVQAAATGTLTFGTANRKVSAPSYRKEEVTPIVSKQKAYIVLNNEEADDMMGLIISENYTAEYEVNADLEKLLGDGNSLKTYLRYGNMNMAYVAINPTLAQEWIPVTVRIPANGEYTFSLHSASKVDELEGAYLIDYENNDIVTNLLDENYTFFSTSGTISSRFAINAIVGERQTPTEIDVTGIEQNGTEPIKFIYRDNVYILHHGVIYDATGKRVKGGQQ